jgi:hypothetical protein
MNDSEDLKRVAKRVVWFKTPEETLQEPKLFLAHLMTYGTLEDIATAMKYYCEADLDLVLKDPPAGVFDHRSWNYWNLRFHHEPIPALPQRTFPASDFVGTT